MYVYAYKLKCTKSDDGNQAFSFHTSLLPRSI